MKTRCASARNFPPLAVGSARPRRVSPRTGSIIPLICFGMVAFLGMVALSIDVGHMTTVKSTTQNACDAAALAGAGGLTTSATAAMDQAALWYLANRTGATTQPSGTGTTTRTYTIGGDTFTATSPYSDAHTTSMGWASTNLIQVNVSRPLALPFGAALGKPSTNIVSRAVALYVPGTGSSMWQTGQGALFAKDQGFNLSCNSFTVKGSVAANSNISTSLNYMWVGNVLHSKGQVSMSGNNLLGHFGLEYGTTYSISCNTKDIASYTQVPQTDLTPPINYDPTKYTTDFNIGTYYNSGLTISANNTVWPAGTYYVKNDLTISSNTVDLRNCTFIVGGNVNISSNNIQLSPNQNCMCFYLLGTGTISLSQNSIAVVGDIYAPNGYISCSSNQIHQGWWVARQISISCNTFELDGYPNRPAAAAGGVHLVE